MFMQVRTLFISTYISYTTGVMEIFIFSWEQQQQQQQHNAQIKNRKQTQVLYHDNNRILNTRAEMAQTIASKGEIDSVTFCDVHLMLEDLEEEIIKVVTIPLSRSQILLLITI
uniref:Uncharacterized protein n=1 Tax=Glossina palpalis gambiensis TaxID=67801 RepID=A0A1B0BPG6_9MUSC